MADEQDLANALFGNTRLENTTLNTISTVQGEAVSDSADGKVKVRLYAESTPKDEDATEENTVVELPTTPSVKEGDIVTITTQGGTLKVMSVTGNTGSGDRVQQSADDARKVATNYIDIDENKGITVGNLTDETLGKNTYIDANGVAIRDGETILAKFNDEESFIGFQQESIISPKLGFHRNKSGTYPVYISVFNVGDWGAEVGDIVGEKGVQVRSTYKYLPASIKLGQTNGDPVFTDIPMRCLKLEGGTASLELGYTPDAPTNSFASFEVSTLKKNKGEIYGETVLYNNTTGTNGLVVLSQTSADFTYLEIFYRVTTVDEMSSVKVFSPNGKKVKLNQSFWASGTTTTQTNFETVTISGTTISRGTMGYFQTSGSSVATGTTTNQFYIVRVDGYK